jgi:hypothetical protein
MLSSFEILRARRFMRIEALTEFVIFSLILRYNWIDPRTPVPAESTAFRTDTYSCRTKEFIPTAVSALIADTTRIGTLNRLESF